MKKSLLIATLVLLAPSLAMAHVSVRPRESKPGAEEQYTVRVPTEGAVTTTHVMLEIPADVTVLEVLPGEGASFETSKQGDRITSITWRKAIRPKASAEFAFRARNPVGPEIVWNAHQHFSDGTVADWIGAAGTSRPAAVTKLSGSAAGIQSNDVATIEAWLKGYDASTASSSAPFVLVFSVSVFYLVHGLAYRPAPDQAAASRTVNDLIVPSDLAGMQGRVRVDALRAVLDRVGVSGEIDLVRHLPGEHRVIVPVRLPNRDTVVSLDYYH